MSPAGPSEGRGGNRCARWSRSLPASVCPQLTSCSIFSDTGERAERSDGADNAALGLTTKPSAERARAANTASREIILIPTALRFAPSASGHNYILKHYGTPPFFFVQDASNNGSKQKKRI
jgi:hypothetical protein